MVSQAQFSSHNSMSESGGWPLESPGVSVSPVVSMDVSPMDVVVSAAVVVCRSGAVDEPVVDEGSPEEEVPVSAAGGSEVGVPQAVRMGTQRRCTTTMRRAMGSDGWPAVLGLRGLGAWVSECMQE